jgi:acyl carrier protein
MKSGKKAMEKEALVKEVFDILIEQVPDLDIKGTGDSLEKAGMDSMAMVKALLAMEKKYGIWLEGDSLRPEVWQTPATVADEVHRILSVK